MPAAAALVCHKPWLSDGRRYGDYLLQFTAAFSANGEVNTLALIHVTRPIFRCSGGLPPLPTERCPPGFVQATPRPSRSRQVRTRLSFARGGGPSAAIRGRDPQAGQSPRCLPSRRRCVAASGSIFAASTDVVRRDIGGN